MRTVLSTLLIFMCCVISATAQNARDCVRKGNKAFRSEKYADAETEYRKAIKADSTYAIAFYNLGCSMLRQNKANEAVDTFRVAAKLENDKNRRAQSYRNIGVVYQHNALSHEDNEKIALLQGAVEAYKESLRNNPKDDEVRYNLALCLWQLKKYQQNQEQEQQQPQDKNDDSQNKKQEEKDSDKESPEQQNQPKEEMNNDNIEQLLQAVNQAEQQTRQNVDRQKAQGQRRPKEKNW